MVRVSNEKTGICYICGETKDNEVLVVIWSYENPGQRTGDDACIDCLQKAFGWEL